MWILSGIIVRVAMRAGYHRDPSHSPQISPFEGEMRRRIWACIYQNDLLLSYQVGLASMVGPSHCDTELPKNYTDGDLNETMETLPEPRPETDATPTLGFILRQRLLVPFREVYDFTTTARGVSSTYSDVLDLDKKIHAAYSTIPDAFRPRTRSQALADQPWLNLRRLDFQLLLHRMRCLLHRKYIALAHAEPSYRYSRDACVDAAVYILQFQQTLIKETEPDGTLHSVLWKLSSFLINDFLLATTILCLDIDRSLGTSKIRDNAALSVSIAQLQTSFPIWNFSVATSRESRHAVEVIRYILKKAACAGFEINPEILVQDDTTNSTAPQPSCVNSGELDSMNAELPTNLGCESDANSTSFAENTVQDGVFSSLMFPGVLSSDTEDLDWVSLRCTWKVMRNRRLTSHRALGIRSFSFSSRNKIGIFFQEQNIPHNHDTNV